MFPRCPQFHLLPKLLVLWALCALGIGAWAQNQTPRPAPAAGTRLLNQAETSYEYAGFTVRVQSNAVEIQVSPVEAVTLVPDLFRTVSPGVFVSLPHRLSNTGNVAATYALQLAPRGDNGFVLSDLKLVRDLNGNGLSDGGEPEVTSVTVEAGESADLVIVGRVPAGAQNGQIARLDLSAASSAASSAQNVRVAVLDTLTLANEVAVEINKSASARTATRGGSINWQITAISKGTRAPQPLAVTVDGAARNILILRDTLPPNVTFTDFVGESNVTATPLYHRAGDALQTYTTVANAPVDAIAWGLTRLESGATFRGSFSARVNDNASGDLLNTAHFFYSNGASSLSFDLPSNETIVSVPLLPPTLDYYTDSSYARIAQVTGLGRPLWLQGQASACNQNSTVAERVTLTLRSQLTGDSISAIAIETGPNTGIFRVENAIPTSGGAANSNDQTLQTMRDDTLIARLGGCGVADAVTRILVDPLGVVFDTRTNLPVSGARVSLVNAAGNPAQVFDFDGVTPRPSSVVTGADGTFQFPQVAGGTYRLVIQAPANYSFPSKIRPANQPVGRTIDASGSYGGTFVVSAQTGVVTLDVPLDPPARPGLFVDKSAATPDAEIGGTVDYLVTVSNRTGVPMTAARVLDTLPVGFNYIPGSARRDGAVLPDATNGTNRQITFEIGALKIDEAFALRYRVRIGAGAKSGKATNSALAASESAFESFTSNTATASVEVRGGVFSTRGIIFGKVWIDSNKNGQQDKGELVVPGARVFLEDGTYAVTDSEGKWSLYGLLPVTHVVKIDETTLPPGARLFALNTQYAKSGATAFADLKNGEMMKVNFALIDASDEVIGAVKTRLAAGEPNAPEITERLQTALPAQVINNVGDNRAAPATGTIGGAGGGVVANQVPVAPAGLDARPRRTAADGPLDGQFAPAPSPVVAGGATPLQDELANLKGDAQFLTLKDGDVLASDQLNVRVAGSANAQVVLSVNGEALPDSRVGTRSTDAGRGVQALEYIGVKLRPGQNTLRVAQTDTFGNERGSAQISVTAPGNLGEIRLTLPKNGVQADGLTITKIGIELVDAKGVRVNARTPLTLEASAGYWKVTDLNALEPGVQVFLENGVGTFDLQSPFEPGRAAIRVSAGQIEAKSEIAFVPFLRPVVAAGLVEGQFGFKAKGATRLASDVFEQKLNELAGNSTGARGAGYVKGRIQGKYLLSMRFDTQSNQDERLFRDIQPDEFYPVYGDSSVKGFDAQSTGKLYVRVDKDNSFVLLGDFSTFGAGTDAISLGRYSRALNGVNVHAENQKYSASAFAARENTTRTIQEIRGNGTGGPYRLNANNIRPQSERVEIIVRDRNNPGLILKSTPQTRFSDYTLDGFTFGLVFRAPIPSLDADGNPVFVRVTYELETGGANHTISGVSGTFKPSERLQIGANLVRDENPDNRLAMSGVNAAYRVSSDTVLVGEYALTDTATAGNGSAYRVELRKDGAKLQARAFTGRASAGFNNPEAALTQGRSETGARLTYKASSRTAINAEAIETKDAASGAKTRGAQIAVDHAVSDDLRISAGVRHGEGDADATLGGTGTGNLNFTSAFARLNARVPGVPDANAFVRYEQDLSGGSRSLAIGGDYQISSRARLYATHEFFDSPLSLYALGDTQRRYGTRFGISSDYAKGQSLFSEYRIAGGIDGRTAQAAIGLRNRWDLKNGIGVNTTFERTKDLRGTLNGGVAGGGAGTAIAIGLDSLQSDTFKWTARAEKRTGDGNNSTLVNAGAAYQPSKSLTFLARGAYAKAGVGTGANFAARQQTRIQLGAAYRPTNSDRWNALARYEFRDGDTPASFVGGVDLGQRDRVHLLSGDVNYSVLRSLQGRLHYAMKNSRSSDGFGAGTTQLLSGRLTRDLGRRFNLSLIAARTWGNGTSQNAYGVELGTVLTDDLMLSLGYNFSKLSDTDFGDENLGSGFYLRMKWKFDEDLFSGFKAFQKAPVESNAKPFVPVTTQGAGSVSFGGASVAGLEGFTGTSAPTIGGAGIAGGVR